MRNLLLVGALLVVAPCVWAQQNPSHDAPSPADLEPGVNTSAPPPRDTSPPVPAEAPAPAPKAAVASKSKTDTPAKPDVASKTDTPTRDAKPAADTQVAKNGADGAKKGGGKAEDHLQLDTTDITGNQELPKVLYIVPWKRSDLGDLLGRPANSLLDEVLQPVDRDVFRRENRYYDALKPDATAAGDKAGTAAGQTSGGKH